ncbi:hypothetical protein UlMin_026497 [Ulmus minor]
MGGKRKINEETWSNRTLSNPKKRRTIAADKNIATPEIFNLPSDLVTKVLLNVTASSSIDIFNAMLSCKLFNKLANDDYFYQKRSLEQFPLNRWYVTNAVISFFRRCEQCGNLEALYRKGMVEYFNLHLRKKSGLDALLKAANAGHLESSYVVGIILVCSEDESSIEEGKRLLSDIKTNQQMKQCREKLEEIRGIIWLNQNENFLKPKKDFDCPFEHKIKRGWNEDEDYMHCEACKWNQEILNVCRALSGLPREYY